MSTTPAKVRFAADPADPHAAAADAHALCAASIDVYLD
jgi:hypothetical protein